MKHNSVKLLLILIFYLHFFFIQNIKAEIVNEFNIAGNKRVSDQTIIMFSNINVGDDIDNNDLNNALKELYYTNYFKDVNISISNNVLNISVIENPIIQEVIINGVNNNNLYEKLKEITVNIQKYPFVENKITEQIKLLKNILKLDGYYFVELKTSIIENPNNTVNLIYDINLGKIAKIKKIKFIGNKIFRDSTLQNIIISEENKFWKFISRNKFLDSSRVKADLFRLLVFYKNRGYYDVKIKSAISTVTQDEQFELVFNIDAGEKHYFDKIKLEYNELPSKNIKKFEKKFEKLQEEVIQKKKLIN